VAGADGSNERLVFSASTDRPPYLFANGPAGSVAAPAWSPEGARIAFRAEEGTVPGSGKQFVVLVNVADGTADWRALPAPLAGGGTVSWLSPNALVLIQGTGPQAAKQLWRMSVPDGQLTRLTNDLSDYSGISLTADRASLVTARVDRRVGVWVADAKGGNLREVAPMQTESGAFRAQLAWVATRVAFTRGSGIWAVEAGGGTPVELVANGLGPSGSKDGKTMVYSSLGANGSDIGIRRLALESGSISHLDDRPTRVRLAPDASGYLLVSAVKQFMVWTPFGGGAARELNKEFVPGGAFDVSRDGTRAVWAGPRAAVAYFYCDLPACATVKTVAAAPRSLGVIRLVPDNSGVAFIDESGMNIWVQPFDGRPAYALTSFRDLTLQDFDWSHDGKHLAIMRSEGRQDIVMIKGLR
jgi:outer membrane protein assembly factor BamB